MTPKEKAQELYSKMYGQTPFRSTISEIEEDKKYAKQCALIAVDELIKEVKYWTPNIRKRYYEEVKQEIEKL